MLNQASGQYPAGEGGPSLKEPEGLPGATDPRPGPPGPEAKLKRLKEIISDAGSMLVAFSGGVDSTFLLKVARDTLGERAAALTATSPTYPEGELREATSLAASIGAAHMIVESNELEIPNFADNTERRCYYCKSELFSISSGRARELGFKWVADGTNADDTGDYRPGMAAATEKGVLSPLKDAGLTKEEIRLLSRDLGLPTWDKPSSACLSSRFPYGTRITPERLDKVRRGEELLRALGFRQFRVRYLAGSARVEVAETEMGRFFDGALRRKVVEGLKEAGFLYVTLDIEGFRSGSMNEALKKKGA
jgi:uncharacterized protein